jgi:DNA replication licensing factor MCM7
VEMSMRKVKERVIAKGFTEDQWLNALEEYTTLDVSPLNFPTGLYMAGLLTVNRSGKRLGTTPGWYSSLRMTGRARIPIWSFRGLLLI